jgi:putative inorganic carbon (hco3(-)) transporter
VVFAIIHSSIVLTRLRRLGPALELLWILLLGLPILVPGRLAPAAWHPLVVALLFLWWPWRLAKAWRTRPQGAWLPPPHSPLQWLLTLLIVWTLFTLWLWGPALVLWPVVGYLAWGIALCVALLHWPSTKVQPAWIAGFLLLAGCALAFVAPPFVAWKADFRLFRLPLYDWLLAARIDIGETIHANVLAGVLALILPLLLALLLARTDRKQSMWPQSPWARLLFGLLFFYVLGLLVLTQSRGGYLGTAVALPLVILLRWPWLWRLAPVVAALLLAFVWWIGLDTVLEQLSQDGSLGGWQNRLDVWRSAGQALADFAFTGVGLGAFDQVLPLLYPLSFAIESFPHAHNLLLQVGVDLGLPGLICFLALLINVGVMALSLVRTPTLSALHRALAAGAVAALGALLVHGMVDAAIWNVKLAFFPWLLYAFITQLFLFAHPADANRADKR